MLGGWRMWVIIIVAGLVASAWGTFRYTQAENARLKTALAHAGEMLAAAKVQLALNQSASTQAQATHAVVERTRIIEREAERELADAVQRQDAHAMYVAWRSSLERLRDAERGNDA